MEKPSLPSGTRDFGPEIMKKRKFVLTVMERVFRSHGFLPIETPSLENLKTLQGKYLIVAARHIIKYDKHETLLEVANDSSNRPLVKQG